MTDLGERVVERFFKLSSIDAEWSVRFPRGFTWWAGPLAQHVWADPPTESRGHMVTRVHARTDFISGFREIDEHLEAVGTLARYATLSGLCLDGRNPARIQLAAMVTVHDQVEQFLGDLLAYAAGIQVAEAHSMMPLVALIPGWSAATSAHPTSGERERLDGMLQVISEMIAPLGAGRSAWAGPEMEDAVRFLQQPPCVLATGDGNGLAAEFPFPGPRGTSLLLLNTAEEHPRLGHGCLCTLSLPHGAQDAASASLALGLNALELERYSYFMGSWCASERGVTYVSFLPNAAYQPGTLANIVMSLLNRATWVTQEVFGYDIREHFEETMTLKMSQLDAFNASLREGQDTDRPPMH